jgi:hypothetical protein
MTIKNLSRLCLAAIFFAGIAYSSDLDDFTRLDIDQDGKLTSSEFSKLAVDRGEIRSVRRSRGSGDRFTKADMNGDGRLSPSEFAASRGNRDSRDRS